MDDEKWANLFIDDEKFENGVTVEELKEAVTFARMAFKDIASQADTMNVIINAKHLNLVEAPVDPSTIGYECSMVDVDSEDGRKVEVWVSPDKKCTITYRNEDGRYQINDLDSGRENVVRLKSMCELLEALRHMEISHKLVKQETIDDVINEISGRAIAAANGHPAIS